MDQDLNKDNDDKSVLPATEETKITTSDSEIASHELLSNGFINQILPKIRNIKNKLEEVTKNQSVMIESLQKENEKVEEWNPQDEVSVYMAEVKHYHSKLLKIRKEMIKLSERSVKLKQRSIKLDQLKQKEDLKQKELKEKRELEEQSLTAKPAVKTQENTSE